MILIRFVDFAFQHILFDVVSLVLIMHVPRDTTLKT